MKKNDYEVAELAKYTEIILSTERDSLNQLLTKIKDSAFQFASHLNEIKQVNPNYSYQQLLEKEQIDHWVPKRFIKSNGSWYEETLFQESSNGQIDVCKIDGKYIYMVYEYAEFWAFISEDLFLKFNKKTDIYGNSLHTNAIKCLLRTNLRGLTKVYSETSMNDEENYQIIEYLYREKCAYSNMYGTTHMNSWYCLCEPMTLQTIDVSQKCIMIPTALYQDNNHGYKKILVEISEMMSLIGEEDFWETEESYILALDFLNDIKQNDPDNAATVLELAFPLGFPIREKLEHKQKAKF